MDAPRRAAMIDALRRLLGQPSAHDDEDEESEQEERRELQAPELAPGPVIVRGADVTAVALRVTLVVVGVILLLLVLFQVQQLVLLTIVALIVAAAMHSPVLVLERRGVPRALAVLLAYAAVLAAFSAAFVAVGGPLVAQVQQLFEDLPQITEELGEAATDFVDGLLGPGEGEEVFAWIEGALGELDLQPLMGVPMGLLDAALNIFIILILSAFFVFERDTARRFFLPLIAEDRREAAHELSRSILRRLAAYVHGRFVVMLFVGAAMTITLLLLGVPFALPLGVFAFLVELIPMVGPWLALIPALAVAFIESPEQALALAVIWFVVQQIESYVLTPAVMGRFQHLPPSVVLLSVMGGFYLFGVFGAIIGVPVVAVVAMVIQGVFVPARKRAIGEEDAGSSNRPRQRSGSGTRRKAERRAAEDGDTAAEDGDKDDE
jgi:predicted PurR-regulated permease PerM